MALFNKNLQIEALGQPIIAHFYIVRPDKSEAVTVFPTYV